MSEFDLEALEEVADQFFGIVFMPPGKPDAKRRIIFTAETSKRGRARANSAPKWQRSLRAIKGAGIRRARERGERA